MRPTHEFPKLPVLHGAALTRLSNDEFFELCQANPALKFERNAHYDQELSGKPVLPGFQFDLRPLRRTA